MAIPTAVALAVLAAGWWGLSAVTHAQTPHAPADAAPQSLSAPARPAFTRIDLSTPENTIASYTAAMKAGDRAALNTCVARPPSPPPTAIQR